jgi:phosphoglycolate phosphatase-like HAD superfamily hydrolase
MAIRTVVLDFDQTLARAHVYHALPDMCINEEEKERVQALFSFFKEQGWDVYIASGNYKDVVVKWLEEIGISLKIDQIWCDRDGYFSTKQCIFETTIAYMNGSSLTGTKGDCLEFLACVVDPKTILYIDDAREEVESASSVGVRAFHKPHYTLLTVEYIQTLI